MCLKVSLYFEAFLFDNWYDWRIEDNSPKEELELEPEQPVVSQTVQAPLAIDTTRKTTFKNILRDIGIIIAIFIVLGAGAGIYVVTTVGRAISTIPAACAARENRIQTAADRLKATVSAATINGQPATALSSQANKDCLHVGGDVSARADFAISAPDVNTANSQVVASLQILTDGLSQSFTPDNQADNVHITIVSTNLIATNGQNFTVNYWLTTPITCADYGPSACLTGAAALQRYNYMQKPINKVTLVLTSTGG